MGARADRLRGNRSDRLGGLGHRCLLPTHPDHAPPCPDPQLLQLNRHLRDLPPVSASNPPGPRTTMSRPPAAAAEPPSSRSSSGSFAPTENHARSVVVKFDQQQIITDYLYSRFQMAGANPSNVQIVDGLAYVSFPTQQSADLASRNRIYYRNGVPMETQTLEKFRQTNV